ncbi:hypothetical protein [Brevibacillus borstelensis]|uniref:hypothetical protein n=1 Tax=Brevibacillus borstelensis TaxID=45462 RepID=UPI001D1429C6|nr:hypothetical protein [Brevibacillus borstelensis]
MPEIVEHMAQAGAAALAIKPERFLHDLPEESIERSLREQGGKRHDIHIGCGRAYPLWHVHQSYTEARKALAIGMKLSRPMEVTAFEDVEAFVNTKFFVYFDYIFATLFFKQRGEGGKLCERSDHSRVNGDAPFERRSCYQWI